jgi:SPP1 gp7 family putative phage head morphogenesis protein
MMLLDSAEILAIESRFISLFDRTFKRGISGTPSKLKSALSKQFKSSTFRIQLDKILDDLCLATVKYTDKHLYGFISASTRTKQTSTLLFASGEMLPLTEEAVKQSVELSGLVSESIIRTLKDEGIYQENPRVLAKKMLDLWGGEKYRAERFARTFSADVATSTTLHRYKQQGIEECQFYATIDGKTSPQCRIMHGTVFKTGSADLRAHSPPTHFHCRSSLIPVTPFSEIDDSLRYENRNFEKPVSQNFKPLKEHLDKDLVKGTFKNIDVFNDKYRIDQFILDEDIEKRLIKLGVGIEAEVPNVVNKSIGAEIRVKIPAASGKYNTDIKDLRTKIKNLDIEYEALSDESLKILHEIDDKLNSGIYHFRAEATIEQELLKPIFEKMDLSEATKNKLIKQVDKLASNSTKSIRENIRELLYINKKSTKAKLYSVTSATNPSTKLKTSIKDAKLFLDKTTTQATREKLGTLSLHVTDDIRAHTRASDSIIRLSSTDDTKTLLHETGHIIEFSNSKVKDAANAFLERRTEGETAQKLADITGIGDYNSYEKAKPDNFMSPYIGKIYADKSTEVISTGLEYMYDNPARLADQDPELFDLIVDVLQGKYD